MHPEITRILTMLGRHGYVADREIATAIYLSMTLRKPLLIEGAAGVGKTEVAKVMARALETDLIRLQCYEGLDATTALYEWNYQKQLLHIRLTEQSDRTVEQREHEIFSDPFLLKRPLLDAITRESPPVLLIDEIDRCIPLHNLVATSRGYMYAGSIQPGDEVLSFNPQTFLPARSTVRRVIRRQATEIVRVFVGGRVFEATPEHKFVRFTGDGFEVIAAEALRQGDHLPIQTSAPTAECEPTFEFPDAILKITGGGRHLLHSAYKQSRRTYEDLAGCISVSRNHLRNVLQPRPFRKSLRAHVLSALCRELSVDYGKFTARHVRGVRAPIQSAAFYELLGYVVADGCFVGDHLSIVDKDEENLRIYAGKFAKTFGAPARVVPGPHRNFELRVRSLPLGRFLKRILGSGLFRSRFRAVPEFVFALPPEKRAAFVRGYFDGEGSVGDHQIVAGSASLTLLTGIQILLGSLGIEGLIHGVQPRATTFGQGQHYRLDVSAIAAFAQRVGFCAPAKNARLAPGGTSHVARSSFLPSRFVRPILEEVRAHQVLHGVRYHQTVYDVLSGRIRANRASLERIASSFQSNRLADLLNGGTGLGVVSRVERMKRTEVVVDFVLSGQPYFVANQVVTHNCDPEFEAFMLEVLSDFQVSIPEIGTIRATAVPYVVLTSNRTRELGDALRRRCLYLWIDYPTLQKELEIVTAKVPGIDERLAVQVAAFMQLVRRTRLDKVPGIAEAIDWGASLVALHRDQLDRAVVEETLGVLLKSRDDARVARAQWLDVWLRGLERLRREPQPWDQTLVEQAAAEAGVRR